ncbi:MFS transporter [Cryobacterium sp. PAMC25264]|uniref:MFS transporter n=1 Tax=Cryobacterium sp. PAMC25264 TaxID=2861288 RepID=UPI001C625683|nr:MFS transporter [Cryobacterium sp. PAMC25264]QYF73053.1 MFS transporter [Cryobacterium sp. PAMC25264]
MNVPVNVHGTQLRTRFVNISIPGRPRLRPAREARRARTGVAVLFFVNGALLSNLLPRYPEIKSDLDLSNVLIGAAVAAHPLGALISGLGAGILVRRFRSSRVAIGSSLVAAAALVLAGFATEWVMLALAFFIAGAMDSLTDVAANSHGLRVQRFYGRSIINSFHAVWSIGAVAGGLTGAAAASLGVPLGTHILSAAIVLGLAAFASSRFLLPGSEPVAVGVGVAERLPVAEVEKNLSPAARPRATLLPRYGVLLAFVIIAAGGAIVEEAGSSWSAIYLSGALGATAFAAGLGFITLQSTQVIGRLLGDRMVDRFGQRHVARAGGFMVFVGMGTALAYPSVIITVLGFGLAGFGVATLIPGAMHAADELPGLRPGTGLTLVSWLLRVGFLISPLIVGAVADASSLRFGLVLVPIAGVVVMVFAVAFPVRTTQPLDSTGTHTFSECPECQHDSDRFLLSHPDETIPARSTHKRETHNE